VVRCAAEQSENFEVAVRDAGVVLGLALQFRFDEMSKDDQGLPVLASA
jgi:hypothetical protein